MIGRWASVRTAMATNLNKPPLMWCSRGMICTYFLQLRDASAGAHLDRHLCGVIMPCHDMSFHVFILFSSNERGSDGDAPAGSGFGQGWRGRGHVPRAASARVGDGGVPRTCRLAQPGMSYIWYETIGLPTSNNKGKVVEVLSKVWKTWIEQ